MQLGPITLTPVVREVWANLFSSLLPFSSAVSPKPAVQKCTAFTPLQAHYSTSLGASRAGTVLIT